MKKILIIIIFLLSSCGYEPLLVNKTNLNLVFNEVNLNGNKQINRKIISSLNIKKNSNKSLTNLLLESKRMVIETSKDSKGRVNTYKMIINLRYVIEDNSEIIAERVFEESFIYNNKDNKSDLIQYQKEIEENLTDKIIEELIVYASLL